MAKDPAALLYIDTWLTSTAEMDADVRGWYLNLILHQYDKKDLPNDIEKLAMLANVKFSEYKRFEQVFEQVFKQKFGLKENGRLENPVASEILKKREQFLDKRSNAGKLSYVLKYFKSNFKVNSKLEKFIKDNINLDIDIKNEQVLKQVFKHLSELYINGDKDGSNNEPVFSFSKSVKELGADDKLISDWMKVRKNKDATNTETAFNLFKAEVEKSTMSINQILTKCIEKNWMGFKVEWLNDRQAGSTAAKPKIEISNNTYKDKAF